MTGFPLLNKDETVKKLNRKNRSGLLVFVVLAGLFVAPDLTIAQTQNAQAPTDDTIGFWVVEALREDPRVRFSGIRVKTENVIVTLTGTVVSLAERNYAPLISMKIQGVRGVVNQLEVQTANRPDGDVVRDVQRRILLSSSIRIQGLDVKANAGTVRLAGTVGSLSQRHEVALLASEVHGVKVITNEITVAFTTRRSDAEISKDIEAAMRRDVYLNTLPIEITVTKGAVVLTGEVGNAYQKERASQESRRVANVAAIDNQLTVAWWRERGVRGDMPRPTDGELQDDVYAELDQDARIDAANISVSSAGGHVTLRGTVPSYYQKQLAEQDALGVAGALWVSNLLGVTSAWRKDEDIASDVVFGLQSDYLLRNEGIGVRVTDGAVTLTGSVDMANEKVHAADIASRIRGVQSVNNKISVSLATKFRDAALVSRVKTRLLSNWETRWVAGSIHVAVENGRVTLTGSVNRWSEWSEAQRVAFLTDGVSSVDNRLGVKTVSYRWEDWYQDSSSQQGLPRYRLYFIERPF